MFVCLRACPIVKHLFASGMCVRAYARMCVVRERVCVRICACAYVSACIRVRKRIYKFKTVAYTQLQTMPIGDAMPCSVADSRLGRSDIDVYIGRYVRGVQPTEGRASTAHGARK